MDPLAPPPEFSAVFGLVTTVVILGIVGAIVVAIMNAKKAADLGHNPLTMQTELQAKVLDSQALSPEKSVEQRLAELDKLHADGLVDDAEYEQTRSRILGSL